MDPLANYVSYSEAVELARTVPDNPDVPSSPTLKLLRKYKELHPYALGQKAEIIVETFRNVTRTKIRGKGKMMVVTASRLATVRYYHEIKRYMQKKGYDDIEVLVAFSGAISDPADGPDGPEYTEPVINVGHDGQRVAESQTKAEFHNYGDVLVVAEKYQTGFDEPLLHTLVVDKKLKDVKAVQTLCRVNRIHPDKEDTYILDFVNKPEDIQKAFERFYTETSLSEQINTDLLYQVQTDIRGYGLYDESDIEAAAEIVFTDGKGKSQSNVQGKLAAVLKPAVARYNELNDDERYQVRRKVRSFCKWYTYITQIVRMFDRDLHKEYVYLSYLRHLLKVEKIPVVRQPSIYRNKNTHRAIIEMMKSVTEPGGTATIAAIRGYHVAGKTGTAQKFINGEYSHKKYTASFVGFVPAEKPRFVLLVTADEPHGAYYGGAVSGPYFKSIAERTLKYMHTPPDMDLAVYDAKFKAAKAKVMEEKRRLWAQEAKERAERARRRQLQKSQTSSSRNTVRGYAQR